MSPSAPTPLSEVALAQLLRAHGLRATAQRRAIYGLFAGAAKAPPSDAADRPAKAPPQGAADHRAEAPPSGAADHPINHHLSAEEVFHRARAQLPELSRATVYNALGELAEVGLLGVVEGPGPRQFDANVAPHHHFRCRRCSALYDIEPEHVDMRLSEPGFEVERAHVLLEGMCPKCGGGAAESGPPRPRPVAS